MTGVTPLILIIISQLVFNFFINEHIYFFSIQKNDIKPDSLFLRFFISIFCFFICLIKKQFKKIKDSFCLIDWKVIKNTFSITRIKYIKLVRFRSFFLLLWMMELLFVILFILNLFNIGIMITRNVLYYQIILWFVEAFLLLKVSSCKKKDK